MSDERVRAWLDKLAAHHEERGSLDTAWLNARMLIGKLRRVLDGEDESVNIARCAICHHDDVDRRVVTFPYLFNGIPYRPSAVCVECLLHIRMEKRCLCGETLLVAETIEKSYSWFRADDGASISLCPACGVPLPPSAMHALVIQRKLLEESGFVRKDAATFALAAGEEKPEDKS